MSVLANNGDSCTNVQKQVAKQGQQSKASKATLTESDYIVQEVEGPWKPV